MHKGKDKFTLFRCHIQKSKFEPLATKLDNNDGHPTVEIEFPSFGFKGEIYKKKTTLIKI